MDTFNQIEQLQYYTVKFARLRVWYTHDVALHKLIFVLAILHLIETQIIRQNQIYLRDEPIDTFQPAWKYLGFEIHIPDISRPFFHLRGDKLWHHTPNSYFRKVATSKIKLRTFDEFKQAIKHAYVDNSLFKILLNNKA